MGLVAGAAALEYPATVELDLVFPLNKTYNRMTQLPNRPYSNVTYSNMTQLPIVFAIQNAEDAYALGWAISWGIYDADPKSAESGPWSGGFIWNNNTGVPHDALDNILYVAELTDNSTELRAGEHVLSWELSMWACIDQNDHVFTGIQDLRAGDVYFTIVDDGSGESKMDWTAECPVYQASVTATREGGDKKDRCSYIGRSEEDPDPCRAKMDSVTAACVLANVTGSSDRSACQELAERAAKAEDDGDDEDAGTRTALTALGVVVPAFIAFLML